MSNAPIESMYLLQITTGLPANLVQKHGRYLVVLRKVAHSLGMKPCTLNEVPGWS
jgi:hypothetical protein